MKKKLTALILILLMALSSVHAFAETAEFSDVSPDSWYFDSVEAVAKNGLMNGITQTEFDPDINITRGMFVTVLGRTLNAVPGSSQYFDDVDSNAYYSPYIAWAAENGIIQGISQDIFAPDTDISREQMAVMLENAFRFKGLNTVEETTPVSYIDADQISSWAEDSVNFCTQAGLLYGTENTAFLPQDTTSRSETAAVITRLFSRILDHLYSCAVKDAETVELEELLPVTAITPQDDMVTWNETKDKVLLLSWHKYPESYIAGETANLQWGEVWTFTDKEIKAWYQKNKENVINWDLRLEQLIGLPKDSGYTHFSAFWVSPDDIIRPAYTFDITKSDMSAEFTKVPEQTFLEWFNSNIEWSYQESAYPWTRIGYTYDWADNGTEFGLSEFLIKKGSDVEVEFTYTTEEFLNWLSE